MTADRDSDMSESPMDDDQMRSLADDLGLDETRCRSCAASPPAEASLGCANCGGTGRLWICRSLSLSDAGLARLARILRQGR